MILLLISDQDYKGYDDSLVVTKTNRRHENPLEIRIYSNIIYTEEQNIILGANLASWHDSGRHVHSKT